MNGSNRGGSTQEINDALCVFPHHLNPLHTEAFGTTPEDEMIAIQERRPSLVVFGDTASFVWISRDIWEAIRASLEDAGYETVHEVEGYMLLRPRP